MQTAIRAPKEFWLGILYVCLGAAGFWFAMDFPMGTAMRMGPGYMPRLVAGMLVLFGIASVVRSLRSPGEAVGGLAYRPILCVLGGVVAFAILVVPLGLVAGLLALLLLSAAGSRDNRLDWTAVAIISGLIVFCAAVFVKGLGVPLPLLGTWFGG